MNRKTQWCLFAFMAALLICGLPFLTRLSFGNHEAVGQQPLLLVSPSPLSTIPVLTAPPELGPETSGAEQARRKRLQAENRQLRQANATLDEAGQKAEADKRRAQRAAQTMAEFSGKLLDPNLKVPQNVSEAASLMGQNLAGAAKFKQKWGDSIPAAGTPEADEYAKEQDALVTQSAALMKFLTDEKTAAPLAQPGGLAQFQAASLVGAVGLRDDQVQAVNTTLDGYYQQFFAQGLNSDARPESGFDAWNQQRLALSKQACAAIAALLTPEQATAFHNVYPASGTYMLQISLGALPGVTARALYFCV